MRSVGRCVKLNRRSGKWRHTGASIQPRQEQRGALTLGQGLGLFMPIIAP